MLKKYIEDADIRKSKNLPPQPLTPRQTLEATELLEQGHAESEMLLSLLKNRVEPGVTKSAKIKAAWLKEVAQGSIAVTKLPAGLAVEMLAEMGGGYNISALIELLQIEECAQPAAAGLKKLTKIYGEFDTIVALAENNPFAREILLSWSQAEWFTQRPAIPDSIEIRVYKVDGEINTDDFSPGNQAQSRADIPLHARFFGGQCFPDGIRQIAEYKEQGARVVFAGDVVGTGSSRKSAINSLLWHTGEDIPHVPNKRSNSIVLGSTIAPIFYATARDSGVMPVECDVTSIVTGDTLVFYPKRWEMIKKDTGQKIPLKPAPVTLLDEYKAGGRLNLIIGRRLTGDACKALGIREPSIFKEIRNPKGAVGQGYTLAQKMIGRACGLPGVLPGTVCYPAISTVGSQDTTGPMTMQEVDELGCLQFKADFFLQSFCHTAAYPKASDLGQWQSMTATATACGGVALKPGDGVIHSWLNKVLIPDTVGTGGDSHTRFPLGISFPAGSGLIAFAGALGFMPLEMPQSVLVRFNGKRKAGITVRDMVNSIPYTAIRQGLLTVEKKDKKNVFAGAVLEIEGIEDLSVEEAFELSDASAERSAAACTVKLSLPAVIKNVEENIKLLQQMAADGYMNRESLEKRILALREWLEEPALLSRDDHAEYSHIIEIDLDTITEPILACPNDPDDVRMLSEVAGTEIDEAFVGSCMTHLDHLREAVGLLEKKGVYAESRLWIAPPTRMDRDTIQQEGGMSVFAQCGGRVEIPGCSLCMGNQARVRPGSTVISTSTRNFNNRLGDNTNVYLGSTPVTVISALKGSLPTTEEYFSFLL